jgi:ubiquinone/menaquinone biosynthesis C-methylase UbiE
MPVGGRGSKSSVGRGQDSVVEPGKPAANSSSRAGMTALAPYWERIASAFGDDDPLAAVCFPGAPRWFNRFHSSLQLRAVARVLSDVPLHGLHGLDVGCGTGRWSRWLASKGARVVGIDASAGMLAIARRALPDVILHQMSATRIEFPDESFDLVMAVTVVQHLPVEEQEQAVVEMLRVLRVGGKLLALDLIDCHDPGRIVFPHPAEAWIDLYGRHGARLLRWQGQEYAPLLRIVMRAMARWGTNARASATEDPLLVERVSRRAAAFVPLWPLVQLSRVLEPLAERLSANVRARHGCFLFTKVAGK